MRFGRVGSDPIGAWLERPITVLSARSAKPCRQAYERSAACPSPSVSAKPLATIIVGVDTHKHVHVAVAIDLLGAATRHL